MFVGIIWRDHGNQNGNCYSILRGKFGHYPPIVENQMEKKMENEKESRVI